MVSAQIAGFETILGINQHYCRDCSEMEGVKLCSVNLEKGANEVTINPLNWKQIILLGPSHLTLWDVEKCGTDFMFSPTYVHIGIISLTSAIFEINVLFKTYPSHVGCSEVTLPESTDVAGRKTCPNKPDMESPPSTPHTDLNTSLTLSNISLCTPPNMSEVCYKDSYQNFIKNNKPMMPKSLCWTPKHSVYVGCDGGQLMVVDVDTGTTTVLVNPQLPLHVCWNHRLLLALSTKHL